MIEKIIDIIKKCMQNKYTGILTLKIKFTKGGIRDVHVGRENRIETGSVIYPD